MTGIRDPATVKYIKTISKSDLQKLENDLKINIKNYKADSSNAFEEHWIIKINNNYNSVNVDVINTVLNNYLK